ncbi:MAG: hypothetical protein WCK67_13135 [bacterium]
MTGINFSANSSNNYLLELNQRKESLKASNADESGVVSKLVSEPVRNLLNTKGCKKKADDEFKKLEINYTNLQEAMQSGNNDSIELNTANFKKQEASFDETLKARQDGNQVWTESILHSVALVAGAELAAALAGKFKLPLVKSALAAVAIGGVTKSALLAFNEQTSNNGKSYSFSRGVKDFLTGGIDAAMGMVGANLGGMAFNAAKKAGSLAAVGAEVGTQALTGLTAGTAVDMIYQGFDGGEPIDYKRSFSSGATTSLIFLVSASLGHIFQGRLLGKNMHLKEELVGPVTPCTTPAHHLKRLKNCLNDVSSAFKGVKEWASRAFRGKQNVEEMQLNIHPSAKIVR